MGGANAAPRVAESRHRLDGLFYGALTDQSGQTRVLADGRHLAGKLGRTGEGRINGGFCSEQAFGDLLGGQTAFFEHEKPLSRETASRVQMNGFWQSPPLGGMA
jgi:hypothetical protein